MSQIPLPYQLFFLYIEPISTLIGAYFAHLDQATYTYLTANPYAGATSITSTAAGTLPTLSSTHSVILSQLANLYLLFALNEGLVLRATNDRRVWRTLLFGLLVADLGHLWSCRAVAGLADSGDWSLYWQAWRWNRMYWGNLGFVYLGATMRACFLMGVGLGASKGKGRVD